MHVPYKFLFFFASPLSRSFRNLFAVLLLCTASLVGAPAQAATPRSLITQAVDTGVVTTLPRHHPNWAVAANRTAQVPDGETLSQVTLVLTRPEAQQKALEQFLLDVQNPTSSSYHKWLTPAEIGERFGLSDADLAAISGWLTSEGLQVDSVSPNRTLVHFSGTAASIGRAFQTSLSYYTIRGTERLSIDSEPTIPQALAPAIQAVRGLSTPAEHPLHSSTTALLAASPEYTASATTHYLTPADFATIYNVPSAYTGAGVTIGIVGWSRVSTTDLNHYRSMTGTSFPNPTEVIPTAYHGVDPGAACTTASCTSTQLGGQEEATLDVIRAGATAPGASLLLVAAKATSISNDGIGGDTEYLVETSPVPAQIISISFGACESDAGASGVAYWDNLFQTGAAEGISVFVSSGDSAAAGCDNAFTTLPGSIVANSPNYICSSQYATCVGGTQFADTASPSTYWSPSNNSTTLGSALGYIPEGGWNESSASSSGIAGSGGGVSTVVATPTWQTGTGVPSARAGRYTPDVSFSGAGHDGYLACLAASGTDCTTYISIWSGTSASAPGMAGVAALLDQKLGGGQGNLNPKLYALASNATTYASVFHDATPTSSGVTCNIDVPSRCNSSIYYTTAGAVQEGFALTTGYDQVTGLGSLNVANFLNAVSITVAPTVTLTPASTSLTTTQSLAVTIAVTGTSGTPTGSVNVSSGSYTSTSATLSAGLASITIPAGSLGSGSASLTATYTPDISSAETYATTSSTAVAVTVSKSTPTVTVAASPTTITTQQTTAITVSVTGGAGNPAASGTVTLTSGSFTSSTATLSGGAASFTIPAGALTAGTPTVTATYTPDTTAAATYMASTGATFVTVTKTTPTVTVAPSATTTAVYSQFPVTVTVSGGTGAPTASGSVTLTSESYSSSATALSSSGSATITIPANSLTAASSTPLIATYTPDTSSATVYNSASGSSSVNVTSATSTSSTGSSSSSSTPVTKGVNATTSLTITPLYGFTGTLALTASITASPSGANTTYLPTFSFNPASITISGTSPATPTLTITTTASSTSSMVAPPLPGKPWAAGGSAILALLALFGIPARRRAWRRLVGLAALLVALGLGAAACGGGGGSITSSVAGTTAGNYTVAIYGNGAQIGTVYITVQ